MNPTQDHISLHQRYDVKGVMQGGQRYHTKLDWFCEDMDYIAKKHIAGKNHKILLGHIGLVQGERE